MMKRRIFILALALLVAFSMMPAMGFASTKIVNTSEKTYTKDNGKWQILNDMTRTYNKKGLESKWDLNAYYFDEQYDEWDYYNSYGTSKYTDKGRLKTYIMREYGVVTKDVYTYKNGKASQLVHYWKLAGGYYKKTGTASFTYSKKEDVINYYGYEWSGGSLYKKVTKTKNADGVVIKQVTKDYYNDTTTTETFNSKGRLTNYKFVEEYDSGRVYTETHKYSYDSYGRVSKMIDTGKTVNSKGKVVKDGTNYSNTHIYKYSGYYKKHKYPTKRLRYTNGATKADEKVIYEYKTKTI